MNKLFPHDLTPQRRYLLRQTWERIERGSLRTGDLQLCLLHFREMKLDDWFWESGSAIAHARRDQGLLWSWALNVWTTHLYYQHLDREKINLAILPLDVFRTIVLLIEEREEWQLADELSDIYPNGITKVELMATLSHLYSPGKMRGKRREDAPFVHLVSQKGNTEEDLRLMRRLVLYCEPMALSIPPTPIDDLVEAVDHAFQHLGVSSRSLIPSERIYLQLHLLVCFHNVLFDVQSDVFQAVTRIDPPQHEAMLSVSAMEQTLGLDIAFYYWDAGNLEQADLHSPDRFERFTCPLVGTELDTKSYLLESDENIRACLYNHPLEVRHYGGAPVIVALERDNAQFKPTRSRRNQEKFKWG